MPAPGTTWPSWRGLLVLGLLLACLPFAPLRAQGVQPVPALSGRVVDATGTLDAVQAGAMAAKLESLERIHGAQLVVLIVPTVAPEDIASYALRVGEAWKIGRRSVGDGLLIVVAKNDRKVRIEVAKGLEGAIPDVAADRIIRASLTPAFKAGDYAGGLNLAIDALSARIQADGSPRVPSASASEPEATAPVPGDPAFAPSVVGEAAGVAGTSAGGDGGAPVEPGDAVLTGALGLAVVAGSVLLCLKLGRKFGAIGTGGLTALLGTFLTGSLVLGIVVGVVVLVGVVLFGRGARRGGTASSSTASALGDLGSALLWSAASSRGNLGGGFSSSSSGGGFSSGGGGDFGGGGASGDW
jgi:uncharacterized protein